MAKLQNNITILNMVDNINNNSSMPSDTFEWMELGTPGSTYTAPSDGYFQLRADINNGYIEWNNTTNGLNFRTAGGMSKGTTAIFLPAKKGDVITLWYMNIDQDNSFIRFIHSINA